MAEAKNPPVKKFRVGNICANVWERTTDKGATFQSVTLERSYKDGEDWKSTNGFNFSDISSVKAVLAAAEKFMVASAITES